MTTQEKCVSLETAKRLREAGWPQNSTANERFWHDGSPESTPWVGRSEGSFDVIVVAAPDIGDLLHALNKCVYGRNSQFFSKHITPESLAEFWLELREGKLI